MKCDQQTGDSVSANEFGGAIHGAEKRTLVFEILAPRTGFVLVDQAGGEVRVDCHLLARHCIEAESRANLGDSAGALRDDDEVHDYQNAEDNHPDDEISAHHEISESFDNLPGGTGAFVSVGQDQPS